MSIWVLIDGLIDVDEDNKHRSPGYSMRNGRMMYRVIFSVEFMRTDIKSDKIMIVKEYGPVMDCTYDGRLLRI